MAGKIFFRERTKIGEGKKTPRFKIVATGGIDLQFFAKHLRMQELEQIAAAVSAELVELKVEPKKGHEKEVEI